MFTGVKTLRPFEFWEGCRTKIFLVGNTAAADELPAALSHYVSVMSEGTLLPEACQGGHAAVERTQIRSLCQI
jgi:hypothetical protein